jgi:hypothetical protein
VNTVQGHHQKPNTSTGRPLVLVTGASTGIGLELARVFADNGFDLIITAEDDKLAAAGPLMPRPSTPPSASMATSPGTSLSRTTSS